MHIFVVDDDGLVRQSVATLLQHYGHQVACFEPTASQLAAAVKKDCELLICEVMLQRLSGLALIADVRSKSPHLPIIVLSGANPALWQQACEDAGAWRYLRKPAWPEAIVREVDLIDRARLQMRVAVVDADVQHRDHVARLLGAMGCDVEVFACAAHVSPIACQQQHFSLWLADAQDPDILSLLGRIRPTQTPVLAFCSGAKTQQQEHLLRAGAAMFLPKPIDVDTLRTQAHFLARQATSRQST